MNRTRFFRGFTLIELMVVVLILAVLAALVVPRVLSKAEQAKDAAAKTDLATFSQALSSFRLDCDRYPTTDEGLPALRQAPSDLSAKWKGPYIEKDVPVDPWKNPYHYLCPGSTGDKDSYDLYSDGGSSGRIDK